MCEEKQCTKWCGRTLPLSEFRQYSNGEGNKYHFSYCKDCHSYSSYLTKRRRGGKPIETYAEFVARTTVERKRREEMVALAADGLARCTTCEKVKPITEFAVNRSRKSGYTSRCKTCFNLAQVETNCWEEPAFKTESTHAPVIHQAWRGIDYGNSRGCFNERASGISRWTKGAFNRRAVPA